MSSELATFFYMILGAAIALAWMVIKRKRDEVDVRATPRPRRHTYGLSRELQIHGKRLHVKGTQELTHLATWHVEVTGPFPDGLELEPRRRDDDDGMRLAGLERWRVGGPAEVIATTLDEAARAALAKLGDTRFSLRGGRLVATLEVPDPAGLTELPPDGLALATLLMTAPRGLQRLTAAVLERDPVMRALALDALVAGHRLTPECEAALEAALGDRDARVQVRALIAKGRRADAVAAWKACGKVDDGRVQVELQPLLRTLVGTDGMAPLWREAITPGWSGLALRRWLASAIGAQAPEVVGALGGPGACEDHLGALLGDERSVGQAALAAIDRVGTGSSVPHLQAARSRLGEVAVREVLLRLQARVGKGGELALSESAEIGALSEVP